MVADGLSPLLVTRGGRYLRVADPDWSNPLDPTYARRAGGRWNPPGAYSVLYLNADFRTARANVNRKLSGLPYGPQDLLPHRRPILVSTDVPRREFIDVVTDDGCEAVGLPRTYPLDERGEEVAHSRCRPVGAAAHTRGLPGIACRSAARADGEELALFTEKAPDLTNRWSFDEWYWHEPPSAE